MASSPSKRRCTSLDTSIQVNTTNTDLESRTQDVSGVVSSRPSYMSPTKASLARLHPDILSNPEESSAPRSKGKLLLERRSYVLNTARGSSCPTPDRNSPILKPAVDREGQEPRASPPTEEVDIKIVESSILAKGTLLAVQSTKAKSFSPPSNNKLISPLGKFHDKAVQFGSEETTLLPSTPVKSKTCKVDPPEPRLPSTPRQLGLEPPAPKSANGISVSPKERNKRKLVSAKSSPLKSKDRGALPQVIETQSESMLGSRNPGNSCLRNRWCIHPGVFLVGDGTPDHAANFATKCKSVSAREDSPSDEAPTQSFTDFPVTPMKSLSELAVPDPLCLLHAESPLLVFASDEIGRDPVNSPNVISRDVILKSTNNLVEVKVRLYLKLNSKKVASVDVVDLSPWASTELGAWLKAPIADRNQGSIVKAIGRYWNMAETRAFCWRQCKRDITRLSADAEGGQESSHEEVGVNANLGPPEKSAVGSAQGISDEALDLSSKPKEYPLETKSQFLGDKLLRFTDGTVTLQVRWDIQFMPSGEISNIVAMNASFPEAWANGPDSNDLPRVSEAFVRLVESGASVYEAIRRIAEIVFPA